MKAKSEERGARREERGARRAWCLALGAWCLCALGAVAATPNVDLGAHTFVGLLKESGNRVVGASAGATVRLVSSSGRVLAKAKVSDATATVRQIREKGYADAYRGDKRPVTLVGVNFRTAKRNIDEPVFWSEGEERIARR